MDRMTINPILKEILKKRNIKEDDEITEFLSLKPTKTYDPFLLLNMEEGVDLILSSIDKNKTICIYGDYDADGITSTSILMGALSHLTDKLFYYIPSRFQEGYGLNIEAIDAIKKRGGELIITVDCGSVSYDEVEHAKEIGLDIIVTDHHTITDVKADCILINPKQAQCSYPFKGLAGCGVAFKLVQALVKKRNLNKSIITEALDLVGIGTIGDIVPLVDENRTLTKFGLRALKITKRKGLLKLLEKIDLDMKNITSEDVAYRIVPHLNASGRMIDAKVAVELLISEDNNEIDEKSDVLVCQNQRRKELQNKTYEECKELLNIQCANKNFLVIKANDAHEGITGIVAGKIKDYYYKPTIIVTPTGDDCYKGTGRSVEKVNLYDALKQYENLFTKFGGHSAACGFSLKKENLELLIEGLNSDLDKKLSIDQTLLECKHQGEVVTTTNNLTFDLADQLELLSPFGANNPRPIIELSFVKIENVKLMGADSQHARFLATDDSGEIQCVLFNKAKDYQTLLYDKKCVKIVGKFESQIWRDTKRLQMIVESIEV